MPSTLRQQNNVALFLRLNQPLPLPLTLDRSFLVLGLPTIIILWGVRTKRLLTPGQIRERHYFGPTPAIAPIFSETVNGTQSFPMPESLSKGAEQMLVTQRQTASWLQGYKPGGRCMAERPSAPQQVTVQSVWIMYFSTSEAQVATR